MKKKITFFNPLLLLFAFGIITSNTFAQPFQSIFGKEKTSFGIFVPLTCYEPSKGQLGCGETISLTTNSKDTITINGFLYQIFGADTLNGVPIGYGYAREDTTTGKIYRYFPDLEKEFLICDMTLCVGDTFQIPFFCEDIPIYCYYGYREEGYKAVVKQIDTIAGRKIIEFYNMSSVYSHFYKNENGWPYGSEAFYRSRNIYLKFIEGVGPIYGPLGYLVESYIQNQLGALLCIHRDNSLYYMTSELLGCYQFGASIDDNESQKIKIYPNPVNEFIHIEVVDSKIGGNLVVFNSIGMVVYQGELRSTPFELNTSHLPSGVYSVLYETSKERVASKFIKVK